MPRCAGSLYAVPSTIHRGTRRIYMEPTAGAACRTEIVGFYTSGDYQLGRRWFLGDVMTTRTVRSSQLDRSRRLGGIDLLAQRIQPGARTVSAHQLR